MKASYKKHILKFKFEAGTSRGVLNAHEVYYIFLEKNGIIGVGEAAPLKGLSIDDVPHFENIMMSVIDEINNNKTPNVEKFPSIQFALETAIKDLDWGGIKKIFDTDFYHYQKPIAINGLVWMNTKEHMRQQIIEKINENFDTIKLKIGALDFEQEIELLKFIRTEFSAKEIEIRVDANGAFSFDETLEKLKRLSEFEIHSIEQPIKANQWDKMAFLCEKSPLPIALDEELIGVSHKTELLKAIRPQYIILKPTLLGGFEATKSWIQTAENQNIKWWTTSALESNIGLNAICQFTSTFNNPLKQGLGTGSLYSNNIESPLQIQNGNIFYKNEKSWGDV